MDEQTRTEEPSGINAKKEWERPEVNELITDVTESNAGYGADGGMTTSSSAS